MKRNTTFYYLLFTFFCLNSLNAQTAFIPDHVFEKFLIDEGIDSDGIINGEVLTSDISGVTILDIKDYNIENFEGLQFFTSLTEFKLTSNLASNISNISFRNNLQLTNIFILEAPGLSSISVGNNIELTSLQVVTLGSNFYGIYVGNNLKLTHLSLGNNALEFLNVDNNIELTTLLLDGNPIGNIDISNNTKLDTLFCRDCTLLTAVDLSNGLGSTVLKSVLLTGTPELNCIKVDNIANAETETGWKKDATATYVLGLGDPAADPFSFTTSEDGSVEHTINLDDIFGVGSGSTSINKSLVAKKRRWWRRNRRTASSSSNNTVVDFPNVGAGTQYYYFTYIVLNDCGVEFPFDVEVKVGDGRYETDSLTISLCNNTVITEDFLSSNLINTNYEDDGEGTAVWYAKWNGEWITSYNDFTGSTDENFGKSNYYKYISNHDLNVLGEEPEFAEGSTITISRKPCSVKYTFANAKNTNNGSKDFYEVDVIIESTVDFKLGSGELFFNYNREAFGEYIGSRGKIELTHPSNYILGEVYEYPAYKDEGGANDDGGGFGIPYYQAKSYSLMPINNITSTPKNLFHLKIEYLDVSKSPNLIFLEPGGGLGETSTACGPFNSFNLSDCIGFPGLLITDVTFENLGAVLSIGNEILANSILIYPNPVSDNLMINSKNFVSKVEIYSVLGKKVKEVKNDGLNSISLSGLSTGMYLIKVFTEKGVAVKKIIKK